MIPSEPRRLVFPTIDILRGFAALSVVVYHVIELYQWRAFPVGSPLVWFRIGWMGVDLFLVISGFVITLSVASLLGERPYADFLAAFARRRFARIAPLYYATCIIYVVVIFPETVHAPGFFRQALTHALFLHNLSPDTHGSIDGANWSVALEMQFYFLCALIAPLLVRGRWWLLGLAALGVAWGWKLIVVQMVPFNPVTGTAYRFIYSTQLPGTLDEFAAGILLARLLLSPYGENALAWGRRWPLVPVAAATGAVSLMLSVYWQHAAYWNLPGMVVFWRTLCGAAFGGVVFAACCLQAKRFLALTAPLRYLGTISFGIYLWHLPVLLLVKRIEWLQVDVALVCIVLATVALAAASWHLFERPLLRLAGSGGGAPGAAPFRPTPARQPSVTTALAVIHTRPPRDVPPMVP